MLFADSGLAPVLGFAATTGFGSGLEAASGLGFSCGAGVGADLTFAMGLATGSGAGLGWGAATAAGFSGWAGSAAGGLTPLHGSRRGLHDARRGGQGHAGQAPFTL